MTRAFRLVLAIGLLSAAAGCSSVSRNVVELPRAPAWRSPANIAPVTQPQIRAELARVLPGVPVHFSDDAYSVVSHEWLEEFVRWTWDAQMALGFTYRKNARDCDKFAIGAFLAATNAAANAGVDATPLVARIMVDQAQPFAGVPGLAGAGHELNGVYSDRPPHFWVLEPQSNGQGAPRLVPLEKYPNRIRGIVLGDFNPWQWF